MVGAGTADRAEFTSWTRRLAVLDVDAPVAQTVRELAVWLGAVGAFCLDVEPKRLRPCHRERASVPAGIDVTHARQLRATGHVLLADARWPQPAQRDRVVVAPMPMLVSPSTPVCRRFDLDLELHARARSVLQAIARACGSRHVLA